MIKGCFGMDLRSIRGRFKIGPKSIRVDPRPVQGFSRVDATSRVTMCGRVSFVLS